MRQSGKILQSWTEHSKNMVQVYCTLDT